MTAGEANQLTFTREAGVIYLLLSLCSLILIHLWLPIYNGDYINSTRELASALALFKTDSESFENQLTCKDLGNITKISVIGEGAVKIVWLAKWKHYLIALSELKSQIYQDDFNHNRDMLQKLVDSDKVVKLIGYCNNTIIMTQFHPLGNPLNLPIWAKLWPNKILNRTIDSFKLCLHFVDLIKFFHTHPSGPLVMCDSNDLNKLLSQLLMHINHADENMHTADPLIGGLGLIGNDLDALPSAKDNGIKCGPRQIQGDFAAPEQHWPYPERPFNNSQMPEYDEKIDIWKIPDVCSWFIQLTPDFDMLLDRLKPIHRQCKQKNPYLRPNATVVYQSYLEVYYELLKEGQSGK